MQNEQVILVDEKDNQIGVADKIVAHQKGLLHRAFSIFIFRDSSFKEIMMQQRAFTKYHTAGLWSNTCCSHPHPNEEILQAAHRRIYEELGFDTEMALSGNFIYRSTLANNLIEHEYDYVLVGIYGKLPRFLNSDEVNDVKWMRTSYLLESISIEAQLYTPWLKAGLERALLRG